MASLSLEKVKKIYENGIAALHTLDLQVADKEFMVILGPSGCGKTSLLRLIAGLDQPSGGVLKMDGRVVTNLAARDRQVAMVFQDYALYPHMTVRENMAFGLKVRKTGKGVINERVSAAAATLGS